MSTDYMPLKKVSARELFDGRLDEFGIREHVKPDGTTEKRRCLTDGRNYMWVYIDTHRIIFVLINIAACTEYFCTYMFSCAHYTRPQNHTHIQYDVSTLTQSEFKGLFD